MVAICFSNSKIQKNIEGGALSLPFFARRKKRKGQRKHKNKNALVIKTNGYLKPFTHEREKCF
jgi:hypothetical protein